MSEGEEEVVFVSQRVEDYPSPVPGSTRTTCSQCWASVWVSPASRPLYEKASRVLCSRCAPEIKVILSKADPPTPEQEVETVKALLPQAVRELREQARAHPWVPKGPPPARHYRGLAPGITACFTFDLLPHFCAEHLSVSFQRPPGAGVGWMPNIKALEVIAKVFFGDATTEQVVRFVHRYPGVVSTISTR